MQSRRAALLIERRIVALGSRATETMLAGIGVPRPRTLLILGHMRSGSTLLLHVLLGNDGIGGMGERNATYSSKSDLAKLVVATRLARRRPFARFRYVVDQINHSRFTPDTALLEHPRVRLLFLIREPEPSLASLLELTRRASYEPWSLERAVDYYVERLGTLMRIARSLATPTHAASLTYEELTERPQETLARLASFLGMDSPFSESYPVHDFTGTRGDPGQDIRTGHIQRPRPAETPRFSEAQIGPGTRAYAECRGQLDAIALARKPLR